MIKKIYTCSNSLKKSITQIIISKFHFKNNFKVNYHVQSQESCLLWLLSLQKWLASFIVFKKAYTHLNSLIAQVTLLHTHIYMRTYIDKQAYISLVSKKTRLEFWHYDYSQCSLSELITTKVPFLFR